MSGIDLKEADQKAIEMYRNMRAMTPTQILEKVKEIRRNLRFIPAFHPQHQYSLLWYQLFSYLAESELLTENDAVELSVMLRWEEAAMLECHGLFLAVMNKFPQKSFKTRLETFIDRMTTLMKSEGPGSHHYALLAEHKDSAEKLLKQISES